MKKSSQLRSFFTGIRYGAPSQFIPSDSCCSCIRRALRRRHRLVHSPAPRLLRELAGERWMAERAELGSLATTRAQISCVSAGAPACACFPFPSWKRRVLVSSNYSFNRFFSRKASLIGRHRERSEGVWLATGDYSAGQQIASCAGGQAKMQLPF